PRAPRRAGHRPHWRARHRARLLFARPGDAQRLARRLARALGIRPRLRRVDARAHRRRGWPPRARPVRLGGEPRRPRRHARAHPDADPPPADDPRSRHGPQHEPRLPREPHLSRLLRRAGGRVPAGPGVLGIRHVLGHFATPAAADACLAGPTPPSLSVAGHFGRDVLFTLGEPPVLPPVAAAVHPLARGGWRLTASAGGDRLPALVDGDPRSAWAALVA